MGGGKVGTCVETEIGKVQHFSKVRRHNVGTRHTQVRLTARRIQVDLFPNRGPPPPPQKKRTFLHPVLGRCTSTLVGCSGGSCGRRH